MARQGTAKQAIDAQNGVTTPVTPPVAPVAPTTPTPINTPAPVTAPAPITPPTAPRVEGQWNYGTANEQVLAPKVETPKVEAPVVKPATAKEAITTGFKQEIKPLNVAKDQPLTTEIGREAKLGQLPNVEIAKNQEEQARINTQNLKSSSGQQLWSNLDTLSKTNPSLLASRDAYDKAFGYQTKDAGEKALVDAFWNAKKNDANGLYNSLATGQKLPAGIEKSPAFSDALIRHQDTTRFENLNPYQLSKLIGTEFIPGTQTYNDLMAKNPQLVSDAVKLASWNMPVTARTETKTNWQDTLSNYLSRSPVMQNPTTVATIMNSDPNIATKTNEVQAVEDKLTEAKDRLKNIQKNVTERYKGTGATKQTVQAKALAESQDIIDEITMLEANKASASSALTTLIQNAKDNYSYARQDRQDALDQYNKGFAQLQSMAEMGMKQDDMEYQRQQDAVNRDLQLLQYYTNIDQANAKEARGYQFQEQSDLRNFDQQKELAKMGYQNQFNLANLGYQQQERMSSINYNQDINKLRLTNDLQTNKELQTRVMDMRQQGYSDNEIANTIYGNNGTGSNIAKMTAISESGADYGRVSSGKGDAGGVSYGAYQLSSTRGSAQAFIDTMGYSDAFAGLKPGSAEFSAKWREMAKDPNFQNSQDKYAEQTYYEPFKQKLEENGISVGNRSDAVQSLLFSTSNQYGKNSNIINDFASSVGGKEAVNKMSDEEFIKKLSQYKVNTVNSYFTSSSQDVRNGVVNRFNREMNQGLELLNQNGAQTNGINNVINSLTPLAKSSYQSKTLLGTPTQQSQILEELTRKGLIGNGEGNANIYKAKPADKKEMQSFIQGYNQFNKANDIIQRRVNDGTIDEMFGLFDKYGLKAANKLPNAIKLPNEIKMGEDYKTLQTILGKELSSYMNQISGATVSDAEVARLMKQIPSLDEWSSDTFLTSWKNYADNLKDAQNGFTTQYGFNDMPTASKILLGTKGNQTTQSQGVTNFNSADLASSLISKYTK